ncbi:MAG TPA: NAD(P)H-binding protein [Candidatus Limnocylindrales bacterium]|nr:NAD(P)H-binding protein [Candidatus Limnocylindrales bacterium]
MNTPILVTGGTGTLGRLVVARFHGLGRDVRVLSRHPGQGAAGIEFVAADLTTGEGVEAAVAGAEVIVHLAGTQLGDEVKTRRLVEAASNAGARHLVYISVVGADRIPIQGRIDRTMFGYFGSKLAAERVVSDSGIPWTTLRATQFEQSFLSVAKGMARFPVLPAPAGLRFQPIDAREVADRLVELALGEPAGLVAEMGGPRVYTMGELIRIYLRATNKRRLVVSVPTMGGAAAAVRAGANLTPDHAVGRTTWEGFVAESLALPSLGPVPLS